MYARLLLEVLETTTVDIHFLQEADHLRIIYGSLENMVDCQLANFTAFAANKF